MQLQSVQFKHVGHFRELNLEFNAEQRPVTLILGDQASGKTTILKNIYQALTWFSARYKDIRSAGVVIADQDIMLNRLQAKIEIQVRISKDLDQSLPESAFTSAQNNQHCTWKLFKTLNSQEVGISHVESQQLEQMVNLYKNTVKQDSLFGLPMIAYYPAERFVQDINVQSKNAPTTLQNLSAYDLTALPYTTFTRFFEWLREMSDVENAHSAHIVRRLMDNDFNQHNQIEVLQQLQKELQNHPKQLSAPNLYALKKSLQTVFPELDDIYIQYVPKLQLMVRYQQNVIPFQQLSASIKTWIALIGDITRRLCLLNRHCFNPCLEGEGILLIDQVDLQLDIEHCSEILDRLTQAFPRLQIIVTGHRDELLEHAEHYQCLRLDQYGVYDLDLSNIQQQLDQLYDELGTQELLDESSIALSSEPLVTPVEQLLQQIQELPEQQRLELLNLLKSDDSLTSP